MLIGNVGQDPDIRHLENGSTLAQFSLATSERFKDRDGNAHEQTEWHNIVAWRNLADIVGNYVKKGTPLYVEGKIRTRSYDTQDGQKRYVTEIVAETIQLLGKREGGGERPLPPEPPEPERPAQQQRQSITEAAAHVAAMQQKGRGQQPTPTTPLIKPQDIADDGADDLPF